MPRYKQKITKLMSYAEFRQGLKNILPFWQRSFLTVLFFYGCRVSEALALDRKDITIDTRTSVCYIAFKRLKGSKQTDPVQRPLVPELADMGSQAGRVFRFSRMTGYRIVQRAFPKYYPHFFRMNSITTSFEMGATIPEIKADYGIGMNAIDHYIAKVSQNRVGQLWQASIKA